MGESFPVGPVFDAGIFIGAHIVYAGTFVKSDRLPKKSQVCGGFGAVGVFRLLWILCGKVLCR
jgi:hypothetical protein